jgi:hypothetical protein
LNFDDVYVVPSLGYTTLPRPYENFVFKKVKTIVIDPYFDDVPVLNTTNENISPSYRNAAVSNLSASDQSNGVNPILPNVLLTTGESLSIQKYNNKTFEIESLYLTSIFVDQMEIFIKMCRSNKLVNTTIITLPRGNPVFVYLNIAQIDYILIGCTDPLTCAHMTYDNIKLCKTI